MKFEHFPKKEYFLNSFFSWKECYFRGKNVFENFFLKNVFFRIFVFWKIYFICNCFWHFLGLAQTTRPTQKHTRSQKKETLSLRDPASLADLGRHSDGRALPRWWWTLLRRLLLLPRVPLVSLAPPLHRRAGQAQGLRPWQPLQRAAPANSNANEWLTHTEQCSQQLANHPVG